MKRSIVIPMGLAFSLGLFSILSQTPQPTDKGIGPVKDLKLAAIDNKLADQGLELFKNKCALCHDLQTKKIGPALAGITKKETPEFLMNYLLNTAEMQQKIPSVKKLIQECGVPMPPPELDFNQARALLEYLRSIK